MSPDATARALVEAHMAAGNTLADAEGLAAAIALELKIAAGCGFHRLDLKAETRGDAPAVSARSNRVMPALTEGGQ